MSKGLAASVASSTDTEFEQQCAACGEPMGAMLSRLGSIRCHDCRETGRSIDATLLARWAEAQRRAARRAARAQPRSVPPRTT